jgi:hypothetical protein
MPPSLEAEPVRPRRSLPIPPGPFQYEPHFGLHEPACFGHALLAHIGLSPSCLFRSGPLRNSNLRLRPDMREDEVDRVEKELANPKSMVVITAVMILLPTCAWLKYVHPVVGAHGSWLSLVITLSLASLCLGFLVTAWLVEPGIMHVVSHVDQGSIDPLTKRPKETWYIKDRVTDQEHSLIEFRAKFCRETGNCIENYDHFVSRPTHCRPRRTGWRQAEMDGQPLCCFPHSLPSLLPVAVPVGWQRSRRAQLSRLCRLRLLNDATRGVCREQLRARLSRPRAPQPRGTKRGAGGWWRADTGPGSVGHPVAVLRGGLFHDIWSSWISPVSNSEEPDHK